MADKDFKVKSGIDLGTPLPISEGGTGQTSAENTLNALLPLQSSNGGKFLSTDGTNVSWSPAASAENATFTGASLVLPSGGTSSRPQSAATGAMRFNTDLGLMEFYTGTSWSPIASISQPPASLSATDVGTSRPYNNGSATVSFPAPSAIGGSAITSYAVTSNPGNFTTTGSASPLTVTGLQSNTSYTFTATATNGIGTSAASNASASITATTVPNAPTSVSATDVGTSRDYNVGAAIVSFTAPETGGKEITSYTATSSPGGATGTGSSSPITVTGLGSSISYTYTVTATNANGTGLASVASGSVAATTVPQSPTIGSVTEASATSVSVAFTPRASGGKTVTGYTVTSSPGGLTGTGTSSPITVSGLTTGTAYTFTVRATNANGTSESSSASASITPQPPYALALTANATQNWTVPAGVNKIAVYVMSGGRGGQSNNSIGLSSGVQGGTGGQGVAFKDYAVIPGEVYSLTVGAGGASGFGVGGESRITAPTSKSSVVLANAFPTNGVATSNVAGFVSGGLASGGSGGAAGFTVNNGTNRQGKPGNAGTNQSGLTLGLPATTTVNYGGGGGGGGGGGLGNDSNLFAGGGAGGAGGSPSGSSGGSGGGSYGEYGNEQGNAGQTGLVPGGGGGGGGGAGGGSGYGGNKQGGPGGSGGAGRILVYTKA